MKQLVWVEDGEVSVSVREKPETKVEKNGHWRDGFSVGMVYA